TCLPPRGLTSISCNCDARPRCKASLCQFLKTQTPTKNRASTRANAPKTRITEKLASGSVEVSGGKLVDAGAAPAEVKQPVTTATQKRKRTQARHHSASRRAGRDESWDMLSRLRIEVRRRAPS